MKGYIIDALNKKIVETDYEYSDLGKILPGGLTIAAVFKNGEVLYVDDEGLMHKADRAFRIKKRRDGQPMMSDGMLTGRDESHMSPDGDLIEVTSDPRMSAEELQEEIEFISVEEALQWFRSRRDEGAVLINGVPISTWDDFLRQME
jgi:hypothetical protein